MIHIIGDNNRRINYDPNLAEKINKKVEEEKRKEALDKKLKPKIKGKEKKQEKEQKQEETRSPDLEKTLGKLGKDYGLIFFNHLNNYWQLCTTIDGNSVEFLTDINNNPENFHRMFFDGKDIYYTIEDSLFKWPTKLIKNFKTHAGEIAKHKRKIIVSLYFDRKIADIAGKTVQSVDGYIFDMDSFNNKIHYLDVYQAGRDNVPDGLVEAPNKVIKKIETNQLHFKGLTILDKLYFGGDKGIVYSYDGNTTGELCRTSFEIYSMHAVNDDGGIIYAGGKEKDGILVIRLKEIEEYRKNVNSHFNIDFNVKETILESKVREANRILSAPIDLIREMNKDAKKIKWKKIK